MKVKLAADAPVSLTVYGAGTFDPGETKELTDAQAELIRSTGDARFQFLEDKKPKAPKVGGGE